MKQRNRIGPVILLVTCLVLGGCGWSVTIDSPYRPAEHKIEKGPNTIVGIAFLKTVKELNTVVLLKDMLGSDYLRTIDDIEDLRKTVEDHESVIKCTGEKVHLIAVTDYTRERMKGVYGSTDKGFWIRDSPQTIMGGFEFYPDPEKYYEQRRTTECGNNGEFHFKNIEDGQYFIEASVTQFFDPHSTPPGAYLMKKVDVDDGETEFVALSEFYYLPPID
ncbi:MAG: hypothetical protein ABEK50_13425 [bacterium]